MELQGFKKISNNKAAKIHGGGIPWVAISSAIGILLPAFQSTITSIKLLFSEKGEVKHKDGSSTKWENKKDDVSSLYKIHYIL